MPSAAAPTGLGDGPVRYVESDTGDRRCHRGLGAIVRIIHLRLVAWDRTRLVVTDMAGRFHRTGDSIQASNIILITIASFGLGGYIAGRLRSRWVTSTAADEEELEFRDGIHGLLVWALAVSLSAMLGAAAAAAITSTSAPAATIPNTTAGEPIIAYDLDRLLRSQQPSPSAADLSYSRAEAARIALRAASRRHRDLAEDRAQVVRIVGTRTGLTGPDAEARVTDFFERTTTAIRKARRSAVVVGFHDRRRTLLGAAVAWFAAVAGGSHRDGTPLSLNWRMIRSPPSM